LAKAARKLKSKFHALYSEITEQLSWTLIVWSPFFHHQGNAVQLVYLKQETAIPFIMGQLGYKC
jgi:hypothetical protein